MSTKTVKLAKDFSRFPAGRYLEDGPYSGQRFRQEFLMPSIDRYDHVVVDLDGARGYGSSFLEEAFGGLVRAGLNKGDVQVKIELISNDDPSLAEEIKEYIIHADGS